MLEQLRPLSFSRAASQLGTDPFDLVRLLVVSGTMPDSLELTPDILETITEFAGIASWYATTPANAIDALRAGLLELANRRYVGESVTRIDNVWRGLPIQQASAVAEALNALCAEGQLTQYVTPAGVCVSIHPDALGQVTAMASGGALPSTIQSIVQG